MKEYIVKSVFRAVKIMELLGKEGSLTVTEIGKKLEIPKASVFEILYTLGSIDIIEKDDSKNVYRLGSKLIELGSIALASFDIRQVAIPFMMDLNEQFNETIFLSVPHHGQVLYIECFESKKNLRTHGFLGAKEVMHCTAVGKALLAFMKENQIEEIITNKGLNKFTKNTITDQRILMQELKIITRRGYAVDNIEHEDGVRCVGVPVRDFSANVIAAISVSGPSKRITMERIPEIAKILMAKAEEISKKMGYHKIE